MPPSHKGQKARRHSAATKHRVHAEATRSNLAIRRYHKAQHHADLTNAALAPPRCCGKCDLCRSPGRSCLHHDALCVRQPTCFNIMDATCFFTPKPLDTTDDAHESDSVSQTMSWYLDDVVGEDASTVRESDTNTSSRFDSIEEDGFPEDAVDGDTTLVSRSFDDDALDQETCEKPCKVKVVDCLRRSETCVLKTHGKQKERFLEASIKRRMKAEEREQRWRHSHAAVNYMTVQFDRLTQNTTLAKVIKDDHWPGYHDHRIKTLRHAISR